TRIPGPHAHWLACIRAGTTPPLSHAHAARHVTEILLAGLESSRTGQVVSIRSRPTAGEERVTKAPPVKLIWTLLNSGVVWMAGEMVMAQEHRSAEAARAGTPAAAGWKLIWSDEFDTDGRPDPRNWTYETGFVRNYELQWYQPDNAWCRNGLLIIEGRRERKRNPEYDPNSSDWKKSRPSAEYTSACLTTKGLHSWRYGRVEMRGRIDTRSGL